MTENIYRADDEMGKTPLAEEERRDRIFKPTRQVAMTLKHFQPRRKPLSRVLRTAQRRMERGG
jgi:hypothetical protein